MRDWSIQFSSRILDAIYPHRCVLCQTIGAITPCEQCQRKLSIVDRQTLRPTRFVDESFYIYPYHGLASIAVKELKFNRETSLARWMANEMSAACDRWNPVFDRLVPVPIHPSRLNARGFNQAVLLSQGFESELIRPDLMRVKKTRPQYLLTADQRVENITGAFGCDTRLDGQRILLIDDVITSGATANECARILKLTGANWVGMLAFAGEN